MVAHDLSSSCAGTERRRSGKTKPNAPAPKAQIAEARSQFNAYLSAYQRTPLIEPGHAGERGGLVAGA